MIDTIAKTSSYVRMSKMSDQVLIRKSWKVIDSPG